jgi:phytoene desaturase
VRRRVVVVGAGLGGLAAAIRLLASGFEVTVVERERSLGGRAAQIKERGFSFDVGPSLITMPELLDDLFRLAGTSTAAELRLLPIDPFYRIRWQDDGRDLLFGGGPAAMRAQIARFSAADAGRFDAYLEAGRRIYEEAILAAGRRAFPGPGGLLRMLPRMARLGALRSVDGFVGHYLTEPHMRQAFGFHPLFIGGDPFRVPAVYAALAHLQLISGVWYAEGGVWSVVAAMERQLRRGAAVLTGEEAVGIERRDGRVAGVRLAGGGTLPADAVVSNADVGATRRMAGLRPLPQRLSMSCFLLCLGSSRSFPALHHHNLLVGPGYRRFIDDVTRRRQMPGGICLYIHAPSRTEPAMAPPGGEAISVLMPVPNLAGGQRWPETGDRLREEILDALESETGLGLAGLRRSIILERRWTPIEFRDRLGAEDGHAFGPEPLLRQSAFFRQHNRYRHPRGLYHVGSGTHPGAGIPGVLLTAEVTSELLAEDMRE